MHAMGGPSLFKRGEQVERSVRTLHSLFDDFHSEHPQRPWVSMLDDVAVAYNTHYHTGGCSVPFEVFYGRPYVRPTRDSFSRIESELHRQDDQELSQTSAGWFIDTRSQDHGLQKHYARRRALRGTNTGACVAIREMLMNSTFAATIGTQSGVMRVTDVIVRTSGFDEFIDRVSVRFCSREGECELQGIDFEEFTEAVVPHVNANITRDSHFDQTQVEHYLNVALLRDTILQRQIAEQHRRYVAQQDPTVLPAGSVVAVRSSGRHDELSSGTPYSKKRKRVVGVLQEPISNENAEGRAVRVCINGSNVSHTVRASKLHVLKT